MAREKKDKLELKGVLVDLEGGKLIAKDESSDEILSEDMVGKILSLKDQYGSLSIEVKDFSSRVVNRAPVFKYICGTCGKEIKTKVEDLHASCKDCNSEFQPKE